MNDGTIWQIPFLVVGTGGHGVQHIEDAFGQTAGDHTFEKSLAAFGYVLVTVSAQKLMIDMWQVPTDGSQTSGNNQPFDSVKIDLATHQMV